MAILLEPWYAASRRECDGGIISPGAVIKRKSAAFTPLIRWFVTSLNILTLKHLAESVTIPPTKMNLLRLTSVLLIHHHVAAQFTPPDGCCATAAMLRFECSQLVIERTDPLVEPGRVQSSHNHQIVGGNSFNVTMAPVEYDPSVESTCTSCTFSEDFSNYWTANLYFRARNGTFKRVPQMLNLGLEGGVGGITVYYIPPYDGKTTVTAFKPVSVSDAITEDRP